MRPSSTDSDPYFIAFVASSCISIAVDSTARGASINSGPLVSIRSPSPSPSAHFACTDSVSRTIVSSADRSQLSRNSTSCARPSATMRSVKARTSGRSLTVRSDCVAIACTIAMLFFRRWLSSDATTSARRFASTPCVVSIPVRITPSTDPSAARTGLQEKVIHASSRNPPRTTVSRQSRTNVARPCIALSAIWPTSHSAWANASARRDPCASWRRIGRSASLTIVTRSAPKTRAAGSLASSTQVAAHRKCGDHSSTGPRGVVDQS